MTREEAISRIQQALNVPNRLQGLVLIDEESANMAIEALSADTVSREHFDVLKKNYDMQAKLLKEEHAKAVGVERPHGRWIKAKMDYGECSECGFYGLITDYCPNCGAKMEGDAE